MTDKGTETAGANVSLLFSGGRDSSLTFVRLAQKGYKVHLLTFDNGAMARLDLSGFRMRELRRLFPDAIVCWKTIPVHGLFKRLALLFIEKDMRNYETNLICMGCKLAMHTRALIYCIENDIKYLADGYASHQRNWIEQMPEAIAPVRELHKEFGVEYVNPIYAYDDESLIASELYDLGMSTKSLEGTCLFGGTYSIPSSTHVTSYVSEKLPLCREYIRNYFRVKNEPLAHGDEWRSGECDLEKY
jgi:hypothetical protein